MPCQQNFSQCKNRPTPVHRTSSELNFSQVCNGLADAMPTRFHDCYTLHFCCFRHCPITLRLREHGHGHRHKQHHHHRHSESFTIITVLITVTIVSVIVIMVVACLKDQTTVLQLQFFETVFHTSQLTKNDKVPIDMVSCTKDCTPAGRPNGKWYRMSYVQSPLLRG